MDGTGATRWPAASRSSPGRKAQSAYKTWRCGPANARRLASVIKPGWRLNYVGSGCGAGFEPAAFRMSLPICLCRPPGAAKRRSGATGRQFSGWSAERAKAACGRHRCRRPREPAPLRARTMIRQTLCPFCGHCADIFSRVFGSVTVRNCSRFQTPTGAPCRIRTYDPQLRGAGVFQ
jgi:hypothetical protein